MVVNFSIAAIILISVLLAIGVLVLGTIATVYVLLEFRRAQSLRQPPSS